MPTRICAHPARAATSRLSAALLLSIIAAVSLLSGGCASTRRPVYTSEAPYDGPPMTASTAAGQHIVAMTAPTSGWSLTLDCTRPALGRTDVFLTATRPDPATMQAQVRIQHQVGTGVPASDPVDVYARVLSFGQAPGNQPYRKVMAAEPAPK